MMSAKQTLERHKNNFREFLETARNELSSLLTAKEILQSEAETIAPGQDMWHSEAENLFDKSKVCQKSSEDLMENLKHQIVLCDLGLQMTEKSEENKGNIENMLSMMIFFEQQLSQKSQKVREDNADLQRKFDDLLKTDKQNAIDYFRKQFARLAALFDKELVKQEKMSAALEKVTEERDLFRIRLEQVQSYLNRFPPPPLSSPDFLAASGMIPATLPVTPYVNIFSDEEMEVEFDL